MFDALNEAFGLSGGNGKTRKYLGKVTNNVDPLGLDRIQANVPDLYDPTLGPVPWIGPKKDALFGIGATWGIYGSPAIGSDVLISLQDDDPHYPEYESVQLNSSASNFPSGTSWGFKDPYGNTLKITSDKNISFVAASGCTITISPVGSITINTPGSLSATVGGSTTLTSTGATTITSSGTLALHGASITLN